MNSALAIAGVTAALQDLLNKGLINGDVSASIGASVLVSALPPDLVGAGGSGPKPTQLNLFLYQVTHNAAYRHREFQGPDGDGKSRFNPPLALDLHYLLTAYGAQDLHAEILLGYAMQLLHRNPVLRSDQVRAALDPQTGVSATLPPAHKALAASGLQDQVEPVRITPSAMGIEEMSQLWSAMRTSYRPTATYVASLVLITAEEPVNPPLPVLERSR